MTDDHPDTRATAQLVEDGYITLQDRMRTYRQARNESPQAAGLPRDTDPVVVLQDAVQTFYELVRPYLKGEPRLAEYWQGAIAKHPTRPHPTVEAATDYYFQNSVGVWQVQQHTGAISSERPQQATLNGQAAATDGGDEPESLAEWHTALGLPQSSRVLGVEPAGDDDEINGYYYREARFAVVGLREISRWEVRRRKTRESGAGFMAGETSENEVREPEPAKKVETAARMLVEVADELNAIATYEPSGDRVHGTPVPDSDA